MFEEVPRRRRGLARLSARRVVLGPLVISGGVALAALTGSAAVAATVITASTVGLPGPGASHSKSTIAAERSSSHQNQADSPANKPAAGPTSEVLPPLTSTSPPSASPTTSGTPSGNQSSTPGTNQPTTTPAPPTPSGKTTPVTPPPSSTGPAGNAVIFIYGYNAHSKRLTFHFATMRAGAGNGGSDLYSVLGTQSFTVGIDRAVQITSGAVLCPPTGSQCTSGDLIGAASHGFFAEVGIDSLGNLRSVLERDNAATGTTPSADPAPSPTTAKTRNNLAPGALPSTSADTPSAGSTPSASASPTS